MAVNEAAWITCPSQHPFIVKEAPMPTAGAGEIVIKNVAVSAVSKCFSDFPQGFALRLTCLLEPCRLENSVCFYRIWGFISTI